MGSELSSSKYFFEEAIESKFCEAEKLFVVFLNPNILDPSNQISENPKWQKYSSDPFKNSSYISLSIFEKKLSKIKAYCEIFEKKTEKSLFDHF